MIRVSLAASIVTIAEIGGGMRSGERREVWRLLSSMRPQSVSEQVARRTGELMRTYRRSHAAISLGDYLIGATVEVEGLTLATLDTRHFPMFRGLRPPLRL